MPRQKRLGAEMDTRQRLVDSFWDLLAAHTLREITVGMLAQQAGVNRGTFYYHYADLDALLSDAIERELLGDEAFTSILLSLATGHGDRSAVVVADELSTRRLCLVMDKCDRSIFQEKVESLMRGMWKTILCPDDEELPPATCLAVEYTVNGMMGMLAYWNALSPDRRAETELPLAFLHDLSSALLAQMSLDTGISRDEILSRLRAARQFASLPKPAASA